MRAFFRSKAFTLIELIVAFTILGIVGMVVVPQYVSTVRHTTDKVARERADLLDLAKGEYRNDLGQAAFYYWKFATNDEAKYQILRSYLKKGSPANLGRGVSSKDYTLEGYTYILNELTTGTTVVRNIDSTAVPSLNGSTSGSGAASSSGGTSNGAASSSGGTTSSSSAGASSGAASSSGGTSNGAASSSGGTTSSSSAGASSGAASSSSGTSSGAASSSGGTASSSSAGASSGVASSSSGGTSSGAASSSSSGSSSGGEVSSSSGAGSSSSGGNASSSSAESSSGSAEKPSDGSASSQKKTQEVQKDSAVSSEQGEAQSQEQLNSTASALSSDAAPSHYLQKGAGGRRGTSAESGSSDEERGISLPSSKEKEPWFNLHARQVIKDKKSSPRELGGEERQKEEEKKEKEKNFIPLPYRGFLGWVILAVVLLLAVLFLWFERRRRKKNADLWRTLK